MEFILGAENDRLACAAEPSWAIPINSWTFLYLPFNVLYKTARSKCHWTYVFRTGRVYVRSRHS